MTYVDDIFIAAKPKVMAAVRDQFQRTWKTSTPEEIRKKPVKFLGVEIFKEKVEKGERLILNQQSYVAELLATDLNTTKPRRIPISRDQAAMEKD